MTEIVEGIGSMSAMLLIISLIAIGAVMAVKNKMVNKRLRRSQLTENTSEVDEQPTESTQDVDKLLDNLKKDVED